MGNLFLLALFMFSAQLWSLTTTRENNCTKNRIRVYFGYGCVFELQFWFRSDAMNATYLFVNCLVERQLPSSVSPCVWSQTHQMIKNARAKNWCPTGISTNTVQTIARSTNERSLIWPAVSNSDECYASDYSYNVHAVSIIFIAWNKSKFQFNVCARFWKKKKISCLWVVHQLLLQRPLIEYQHFLQKEIITL